jgi:hypothetical protein
LAFAAPFLHGNATGFRLGDSYGVPMTQRLQEKVKQPELF